MKGDALLNFVEQTYVDIQHEVTDDPIEWKLRTGKYNQTKRTSIAEPVVLVSFPPPSNLFHCLCHDLLYSKNTQTSLFLTL